MVKKKEKKKTKKCPALLRLLYFLPLITVPYDLTIASVVSVLGYTKKCTYHMYIQTTKLEAGAKRSFVFQLYKLSQIVEKKEERSSA